MRDHWTEFQQRRWTKPNGHLWMRPDAQRWLAPNQRVWQGPKNWDAKAYDPTQPRVPAGNSDGGQWTTVSSGGGISIALPTAALGDGAELGDSDEFSSLLGAGEEISLPAIIVSAAGEDAPQERVQVAGPGGGRGRWGGNFPGASYSQLVRLDLTIARTESLLEQVRQYDPTWRPRSQSLTRPGSIEGAIGIAEARAEEAQARLEYHQRRTSIGGNLGPPLDAPAAAAPSRVFDGPAWIAAYRIANNRPNLFGEPTWPYNKGTVAVTNVDGRIYVGVNSEAPGYTKSDFVVAQATRDALIEKYSDVLEPRNVGWKPNDSLFHAESNILLRLVAANGGSLDGRSIEIYLDNMICVASCQVVLPYLAFEIGNPYIIFVQPDGTRRIVFNRGWR